MKPLVVLLLAMPAYTQEFTVASMKLTELLPDKRPIVTIDPGRFNLSGLTLQSLIARAHGVKEYQVKGPEPTLRERYTILATMPADTAEAAVWLMLRRLLDDRLQLRLRQGREEMSVYAIVTGKSGPKLKAAAGGRMSFRYTGGAFVAANATVENLANFLGGFLDRPVVDRTGLDGAWDFTLAFTPDPALGSGMAKLAKELEFSGAASHGGSIFAAIQDLGLKVEARKLPVDVLIVESARKVPVEN